MEELEPRNLLSGLTMLPQFLRSYYGFDAVTNQDSQGNQLNGHGETIAIIDPYHDPNIFSDLDTFDKTLSLQYSGILNTSPVSPISIYAQYGAASTFLTVAAPDGTPATANASVTAEISADVESAHVIAPGAKILLVEATSYGPPTSYLMDAVNYASSHGAAVVSMSFGESEATAKSLGDESNYDNDFVVPGVTFVASSGDTGQDTSWPAVSPNVVGVGGTTLGLKTGNYLTGVETAWSASSGGISQYEVQPSYQKNLAIYGQSGVTMRVGPDVSFDGDPNTGVYVYDYLNHWFTYGGTSIGAPQWAALIAIADQGRASSLSSQDTLTALYGLPSSDFYDVTSGGNVNYSAGPGFDLVTGLGTPHANLVISGLVSYVPPPAAPTSSVIPNIAPTPSETGTGAAFPPGSSASPARPPHEPARATPGPAMQLR